MATRFGKDLRIEYDDDLGRTVTLRQRLYGNPATQIIFTPVPPLVDARLQPAGLKAAPRYKDVPRRVTACVPNDTTQEGFSRVQAVVPYRPGDDRWETCIAQYGQLASIERYTGESYDPVPRRFND